MKFELNERQNKRLSAWFKHHWEVIHEGFRPREMSGAATKFTFVPTGIGDNVSVECLWCKDKDPAHSIDLTIDDDDDFVFQYDADWNWIKP